MRILAPATLLMLLVTTGASAQQATTDPATQLHRGNIKIWVGAAFVGAGAIVLPITATHSNAAPEGAALGIGVGSIAIGTVLIWMGGQERRAAVRPRTMLGVSFGRSNRLQIARSW